MVPTTRRRWPCSWIRSDVGARSEQFRALLARQPENELFHFSLAQALVAEGEPESAVPHFEFCVAKKNDWMMPRIRLGKLHLQAGRRPEAGRLLEEALTLAVQQQHEDPERELRALLAEMGPAPR